MPQRTKPSPRGKVSPARLATFDILKQGNQTYDGEELTPRWNANEAFKAMPARERALANRLVRGIWQHRALLDALLQRDGFFKWGRTERSLRWVLRLAAYEKIFLTQSPDYAIGQQAVALARARGGGERPAKFINALMRRLLPALPKDATALRASDWWATQKPEVKHSVPRPLYRSLSDAYGDETESAIDAMSWQEPTLWLRANTLKGTPEECWAKFSSDGRPAVTPHPLMPEAGAWDSDKGFPWQHPAWGEGWATVQDLGAMLAAQWLDVRPGMTVLDACAAPGGKTGQLWEHMQAKGRLVALEVASDRRKTLKENMLRLYGEGFAGVEIPEINALAALPAKQRFDRILLDVPCLALGLLRRHPESRWSDRLNDNHGLLGIQRSLIEQAATLLKPGGRLLYMTCSPTRMELETQRDWVKDSLTNLQPVTPAQKTLARWKPYLQYHEYVSRTLPHRQAWDGFGIILFEAR